jgi:ubiquinone/menaquinone biosynthesis C-methylase UbiE
MHDSEFDSFATNYSDLHKQNIAISGEEPAYFADYKMRDFKALVAKGGHPAEGRYLDFGSGIGASVKPFHEHMPHGKLVCADVSAESLAISRQAHGDSVEYEWISYDKLPFHDAEFDGIFACCVFHHIPHENHQQSLRELRRVLKPGGLLMVYEHNPFNPLTVRSVRNCPFDENAVLITSRKLQRTVASAGLRCHQCDYRVFFPAVFAQLRPLENWLRWLPLGAQYFVAAQA